MKKTYLLLLTLTSLAFAACNSERSDSTADTVTLDSPAVSDDMDIKATDADSITIDTLKK